MTQWRLFPEGTVPECATAGWYAGREAAPHLEQPGHRERLLLAASWVMRMFHEHRIRSVIDLGAGDGGLLSLLPPELLGPRAWGYDLQPTNVEAARRRGVRVELCDVVATEPEWADVAVATEMLEHLVDPAALLARIREHCRFLVASSPWDETGAHHYEFHLWAWDALGYRELVERAGFEVLRHEPVGRFQVLLAEAR